MHQDAGGQLGSQQVARDGVESHRPFVEGVIPRHRLWLPAAKYEAVLPSGVNRPQDFHCFSQTFLQVGRYICEHGYVTGQGVHSLLAADLQAHSLLQLSIICYLGFFKLLEAGRSSCSQPG